MEECEVRAQMIEHKQYDVIRAETHYRWDFGIHHVANKYDSSMGDEVAWRERARTRAAARIAKMMEQR